jgi:outer membrane protein assembly factor BamB
MRRIGGVVGVVVVLSGLLAGCDLPTYPDGTQQLSPQAGPAGTGASATTISATPTVRWRWAIDSEQDGGVGTPVIKGDLVIVPVFYGYGGLEPNDTNASRVIAFHRLTGEVVWETLVGHDGHLQIAASGTMVFAQGNDSGLTALDLATGAERWHAELTGTSSMGPTVVDGVVYTSVHGTSAEMTAFEAATGDVLWFEVFEMITGSSARPVVSGDVVYLPGICGSTYAARRSDGQRVWYQKGGCYGGGDAGGVVRNGRVYSAETGGNFEEEQAILSQATGARIGTFASRYLPVVGRSNMILAGPGTSLENWSVDGRMRRWHTDLTTTAATEYPRVHMAPLAASNTVFAVVAGDVPHPGDGLAAELIGVGVGDGKVTHRVPLGTFDNILRSRQQGLAAGNHVIAVAWGGQVVVVG